MYYARIRVQVTRVLNLGYVLELGYEGIRSAYEGIRVQVTRVLEPGYEVIRAGVRGY